MHCTGKGPHRGRCGALPSMQRQRPMGPQRLCRLLPELRPLAATPPSYSSSGGGSGGSRGRGGSSKNSRPRWARASSAVWYTPAEVRELEPVREQVERRGAVPDLRDVFLCHAWDGRQGAAKELHDLLEARGVKVWFSEKDIALGEPFLREIDRGLAKSRVGIVLVTPIS